jgi:hypothetical protein
MMAFHQKMSVGGTMALRRMMFGNETMVLNQTKFADGMMVSCPPMRFADGTKASRRMKIVDGTMASHPMKIVGEAMAFRLMMIYADGMTAAHQMKIEWKEIAGPLACENSLPVYRISMGALRRHRESASRV